MKIRRHTLLLLKIWIALKTSFGKEKQHLKLYKLINFYIYFISSFSESALLKQNI